MLKIECIQSTVDKGKDRISSDNTKQLENRLKIFEGGNSRIAGQLENIAYVMKKMTNLN